MDVEWSADNQVSEVRRSYSSGGPVAQWITRLPTEQKIPGSNPGWFEIFHYPESDLNLTHNLSDLLPITAHKLCRRIVSL